MDPTETLSQLLIALAEDDKAAAQDHAENLADWLSKDGFVPDVPKAIADYYRSVKSCPAK